MLLESNTLLCYLVFLGFNIVKIKVEAEASSLKITLAIELVKPNGEGKGKNVCEGDM